MFEGEAGETKRTHSQSRLTPANNQCLAFSLQQIRDLQGQYVVQVFAWSEIEPAASQAPNTPQARTLLAAYLRIAVASERDPDAIVEGTA